jgi:acetyltransferase-like isoleucine patch superfamily enzyme
MGGQVGSGFRVGPRLIFKTAPHKGIIIGSHVSFGSDVVIDVPECGTLKLGDRVKLNLAVLVSAQSNVVMGDDVIVGEYTSIRDADHGMALNGVAMQRQSMVASPVHIGSDVWIGRGVAVLKGSYLGDGAVIGANAVVLARVENDKIAVGIPARSVADRAKLAMP